MTQSLKTMADVRRAGIKALNKTLGPVDAVRFLQQYEPGKGDYTANRRKWLGNPSVDSVMTEIKRRRRT